MRIEIDNLSHDGKGVARIAGKVSFVPGALAGETVNAELRKRYARYDEYRLTNVISAAPDRTEPSCPLVGRCGGCDLQHLVAHSQLGHKTDVVLELLQRQAGLVPQLLVEPLRSAPYGYRRRARLAVFVPRRGGKPVLGFREASGHRVVAVDACPVLAAPLAHLPGVLQEALSALERPADLGHLELSVAESSDGALRPVIYVRPLAAPGSRDRALLAELAASQGAYLAVRTGAATLDYVHRPTAEAPAYLLPEFDLRIDYEPGDFLQGNAAVNRQLVSRLVQWLEHCRDGRVLDAFAGLGNFSLALARRGFGVLGMETVAGMVNRARDNALTNGLANADFMVRDLLGDPLALQRQAFDTAVLDPPRAGARWLVTELAARSITNILYVSCSPPTLARDAAILAAAGYQVARLCLVDMFPQTSHIEAMALFTRRPGKRR